MDGIKNNETSYESKLDVLVTRAAQDWWNGLTKEEILKYLADQKSVTADTLRAMIGNNNAILAFDIRFAANSCEAVADFKKDQ